jgi:hypothetical protein
MTDDLENELRNLKFRHLSESELTAYCGQELAPMRRVIVEAHLKQCFICERQLALLREEIAALSNPQITAEDVALVERLMEQMGVGQPTAKGISLRERLAGYLRQMVASWQIQFAQAAMRGGNEGEEVWRWQSEDGKLQARAVLEKNADLIIHFSSSEGELEGVRLNVRLGPISNKITLRRISESEVYAKVEVPRRQRPRELEDIAIEIV